MPPLLPQYDLARSYIGKLRVGGIPGVSFRLTVNHERLAQFDLRCEQTAAAVLQRIRDEELQ